MFLEAVKVCCLEVMYFFYPVGVILMTFDY